MTPVWAQRREEMWSDCLVSPDVFNEMVDRLGEFVMLYRIFPADFGERQTISEGYVNSCCFM